MRLKKEEQNIIVNTIKSMDGNAEVYLFGSRTDDNKRGGDIDILVLSSKLELTEKLKILVKLHKHLGERKIDLLIYKNNLNPFAKYVLEGAIQL
jgi:predicted nucleotidyltransferase